MFLFAALMWAASVGFGVVAARVGFDREVPFILLFALAGIAGLVLTILAITFPISAGYDKRQCYRYGNLTGREVKYQRFSYWTWDCYVRTESGNWISKDQVRGVDQ